MCQLPWTPPFGTARSSAGSAVRPVRSIVGWENGSRVRQRLGPWLEMSSRAAALVVYVAELDRGFLPDLVVICGAPLEAPGKPGAVTNPSIIFEVLSPTTQSYDRTTKSHAYQRLPSLQAYVLMHRGAAGRGVSAERQRVTPRNSSAELSS